MPSEVVHGVKGLLTSWTDVVHLALNKIATTLTAAVLFELSLGAALDVTKVTSDLFDEVG